MHGWRAYATPATYTIDWTEVSRPVGLRLSGKPGEARREYERSRSFRRMRNWRVGIEARISHLKRTFGLRRTRLRRLTGAQTWSALGIFVYNLQQMAVVSR